jgi:ferredoxin
MPRQVVMLASAACAVALVQGLALQPGRIGSGRHPHHVRAPTTSMNFFEQLSKAFENDDTLGESGPAGLKNKVEYNNITWQGPPPEGMAALFEKPEVTMQQAIAGQSLKDLGDAAGIPLKYSCMQGTCGICDVTVDGQVVPACTAVMPKADVTIEYKTTDQAQAYMKEKMKAQRAAKKAGGGGKAAAGAAKAAQAAAEGAEPAWLKRQKAMSTQIDAENAKKKAKSPWPFG